MRDYQGREIDKIRISLTESCQLLCPYCLPRPPSLQESNEYLSYEELYKVLKIFKEVAGISRVRLTGGEPLLRRDLAAFVSKLKSELGMEFVGVTTNGVLLQGQVESLVRAGIDAINVSLDSLDSDCHYLLTRNRVLESVLAGIEKTKSLGVPVKINTVVLKGINAKEIPGIIEYANKLEIMPRFLELMNIGKAAPLFDEHFMSSSEILSEIEKKYGNASRLSAPLDSTALLYEVANLRFGIIGTVSNHFCQYCSRLRLSAKGMLFGCLMSEESLSVRPLLENESSDVAKEILKKVTDTKPSLGMSSCQNLMNILGG